MGLLQTSHDRIMLGDYLREMFATFFFTIIVGLTTDTAREIIIPALAIGFGCTVLAESERAHMNPIISLAVAICDPKMGWTALFLRVLAQLVGCILGGLTAVDGLRDQRVEFAVSTFSGVDRGVAFELFFSFLMVLIVLRTRKFPTGSISYGLCYTMAILTGKMIFSGNALINPATAVGVMLGSSSYDSSTAESYLWIYIVAPIIGALLAVVFFQFTEFLFDDNEDQYDSTYTDEVVVEGKQVVRQDGRTKIVQQHPPQQADRGYQAQAPGNYSSPVRRRVGEASPNNENPVNREGNVPAPPLDALKPSYNRGEQPQAPGTSYQRPVTRSVQRRYPTSQINGGQHLGTSRSVPAQRGAQSAVGYRDTQYEI